MSNGSKINLLQMQHYFEEQIDRIHVISDLELSENDYRSLSARLNEFSFFAGSENDIEEYILSIVVHSVYTLIYGKDIKDFDAVIRMLLKKSQYAERLRLIMYRDAFYCYGLNTFDISGGDLKEMCRELSAVHAGIPNSEKNLFFNIIDEYIDVEDDDEFYNCVRRELSGRTKYIFELMRENTAKRLLLCTKKMLCDVADGILTRNQLIKNHSELSISLIDRCIMWNENNNQQIRYGIK